MNSIEKAELYFILPVNNNFGLKKAALKNDQFLKKLIDIQEDEFTKELCDSVSRNKYYDGEISYQEYTLPLKIYISNYLKYPVSLFYLKVSIHNPINLNDFLNLINEKNILHNTQVNNKTLLDYLSNDLVDYPSKDLVGFGELDEIFLFLQIAKTNPEFPNTYYEGMEYIEEHKQKIHQLLLRSDTYHGHIRIDNHQSNFDSISNFYGTIDLCSPITLIQFYQYPINSIGKKYDEIDINHRACWWLVITDMIFIQKSVLADTLKKINAVQMTKKMKTVKATTQFGKALLNMKGFWYFEDVIHEISKAVLFKVKEKVGVTSMLNSVLERVGYLENMVLREINEEQNEQNRYLNVLVLAIALIQIVPVIYGMLSGIDVINIGLWIQAFVISISFPLMILILRKFNKRKITSAMLAIKKKQNNN